MQNNICILLCASLTFCSWQRGRGQRCQIVSFTYSLRVLFCSQETFSILLIHHNQKTQPGAKSCFWCIKPQSQPVAWRRSLLPWGAHLSRNNLDNSRKMQLQPLYGSLVSVWRFSASRWVGHIYVCPSHRGSREVPSHVPRCYAQFSTQCTQPKQCWPWLHVVGPNGSRQGRQRLAGELPSRVRRLPKIHFSVLQLLFLPIYIL